VTYTSTQIEKGESLYAAADPKANKVHVSYPFDRRVFSVDIESKSVDGKIGVDGAGNITTNPLTNMLYIPSYHGIDVIVSQKSHSDLLRTEIRIIYSLSKCNIQLYIYPLNLS
jgi:hypothetical protein